MIILLAFCLAIDVEITNGGAETGDLSGWSATGPVVVVSEQNQSTGLVLPAEGNFFFSFAAFEDDLAAISQTGTIASDTPGIVLSGYVQTEFGDVGEAELCLLDADSDLISSVVAGDLNTPELVWEEFRVHAQVPANATQWRVELRGNLVFGAFVNVFWDGIELGIIGDVNGDGGVNLLDVEPFVQVLSTGEYEVKTDINQDGIVNLLDVGPFVDLLSGN